MGPARVKGLRSEKRWESGDRGEARKRVTQIPRGLRSQGGFVMGEKGHVCVCSRIRPGHRRAPGQHGGKEKGVEPGQ